MDSLTRRSLLALVLLAVSCAHDLSPSGSGDAGLPTDASASAPTDATGAIDASAPLDLTEPPHVPPGCGDAGVHASVDGGRCAPERFKIRGDPPLVVGLLCDDILGCVDDEATACAVMAAGAHFQCWRADGTDNCQPGRWSCRWMASPEGGGPSVLDQGELDEVCGVTLQLTGTSSLTCAFYL